MAKFLPQLKTTEVIMCNNVEEIFAPGNEVEIGQIELGQVRSLALISLPQFQSFSTLVKTPSTVELRDIAVAKIWRNKLSATMSCNVRNLTRLIVQDCRKLFSYSTAESLEQLQNLVISRCPLLQEIVAEEGETEGDATFVFPWLASLEVDWLTRTQSFLSWNTHFEMSDAN